MAVQAFPTTYTLADFNETETDVAASQFTTAYQLEVDKGTLESLGRGVAANQTDAEGRVYADFQDSSANQVTGKVRFAIRTKQGRLVSIINEMDLAEIDGGLNSRGDRYPFPIQRYQTNQGVKRWVGYPFVLTIEIEADADVTLDTSASTLKADGKRGERTA